MWRYLVGGIAALLLAAAGVMLWRPGTAPAGAGTPLIPPRVATPLAPSLAVETPPAATEQTREERRFARADRDKDGTVAREEYLANRRKAFARLDANRDGRLSFDEWAVKTTDKFARADADRSGMLTATEFATTRVIRKAAPRCACPRPAEED